MTDLFNDFSNHSEDYIHPTSSPCPGTNGAQTLVWTKNGLTIISGSQEIANADFADLAIPIAAYTQQQKILEGGEVTFIQGLTKGLNFRTQGFDLPSLDSSNADLNPFFMQIDLSISYYKNFGFVNSNIDVSANYGDNIDIETALNLKFSDLGINISCSYDPSIITFSGGQEGYDFNILNVFLTIIDSSEDSNSPFGYENNAVIYDLVEDLSANIHYAKYSNTAMQGIILRGIYPDKDDSNKWVYLNHVSDFITTYNQISINYDTDVSTNIVFQFDPSTFIVPDVSFNPDPSYIDVSINNQTLSEILTDDCIFEDCSLSDSMFTDSEFISSQISDSSIASNSIINDDSSILNSLLVNAWVNGLRLLVHQDPSTLVKTYEYNIDDNSLDSLGRVNIYDSSIWDSSINNAAIYDCSIYNSYLKDSSLIGCTLYNSVIDSSTTLVNTIDFLVDASIGCQYEINSDASIFYIKKIKRLEVGMSGCSYGDKISAGDYLNWITVNNKWKKVGEMYIWVSPVEAIDPKIKNLIDGFYVFNPHNFEVKLEYMIFI